jgi:hypothetical protein
MEIDRLSDSLLNGRFLQCRPVENGPVVEAHVIPSEGDLAPTFKVAIICPERRPSSKCELRSVDCSWNDYCLYYKGDSRGNYQIIGPNMDKKLDGGWK